MEYIDGNYYLKVYCDRKQAKWHEDKEGNIYYRDQQTDTAIFQRVSHIFICKELKIGDKIRYAYEWDADGVKEREMIPSRI